jgi:outer membrane receptor protein involved in Fe transport
VRVGYKIIAVLLLSGCSGVAFAQDASAPPEKKPADANQSAAEPTKTDDASNAIIVTGSLIPRRDFVSSSPILSTSSESLATSGPVGTIDKGLSQLPQFTPTAGSGSSFPNRLGQALLNLRGLGSNRMLVLLDGRRIQPSAPDGTVDVNLIPTSLIDTVETITGGASATYGSDAITGVVNFKLLSHFQGLRLSSQLSLPEINSGASLNASGTYGTAFADDRGSVILSLDYTHRDEVFAKERPFYVVTRSNAILPLATVNFGGTLPSQAAVDAVFGTYGIGPGSVSAKRPIGVNYDGTLFSPNPVINYRGPLDDQFFEFNGGLINSAGRDYSIQPTMDRYNAYARASYDLGGVEVYASGLYNHSKVDVNISTIGLGQIASANVSIPASNPFIPADLRTLLNSRSNPNANFAATYLLTSIPPVQFRTIGDIYQILGGAKGKIAEGWSWNAYATYGKTKTEQTITGFSLSRVQQLLDAADGGNALCQGGLNIFQAPEDISQACRDYIANSGTVDSDFDQTVLNASVQGDVVQLPAGPLQMVFGAEYRRNSFNSRPTANFIAGDVVPQGKILPARGSQSVKELFTEALIPVLRDLPLIESLNVGLAYRYSDYRTFGGVSTYKADVDWSLFGGLMARGGYSHAIRAPSLSDLFTPASLTSVALGTPGATNKNGDPCDVRSSYRQGADAAQVKSLCLAQGVPASIIDSYTFTNTNVFPSTTGNPNLRPETADTYTVGVVWRSRFASPILRRFQVSVDYYNIKVEDAIGSVPFLNSLRNCFNADDVSNPTYSPGNIFCGGIVRNSLGQITQDSTAPVLNLAAYKTQGIDSQVDWRLPLDDLGLGRGAGTLSFNYVATRLLKFIVQSYASAPALDFAGSSQGSITNSVLPKWKSVLTATYENSGAELSFRWRYIGKVQDVSQVTTVGSTVPGVPAVSYFDLNAKYTLGLGNERDLELRAGVSNLTNRRIPQVGPVPGTTDPTTYDIIGRTFYVGATIKL